MPKSKTSFSINISIEKIFDAVANLKNVNQYPPAGVASDVVGNPE